MFYRDLVQRAKNCASATGEDVSCGDGNRRGPVNGQVERRQGAIIPHVGPSMAVT